jgi:hypothetical protein
MFTFISAPDPRLATDPKKPASQLDRWVCGGIPKRSSANNHVLQYRHDRRCSASEQMQHSAGRGGQFEAWSTKPLWRTAA